MGSAAMRCAFAALTAVFACACRVDMHIQPKIKADRASAFFQDGRGNRPEIPDTVIHGQPHTDQLLYTGRMNGALVDQFPFPITRQVLDRGRARFNIYCTPCHDYTGSGRGMVVQRGFPAPPSYHIDRLRQAPAGHFFEVITDGYGAMFSYAGRIPVEDRWAIVAYIRALQLSQHATLDDVPADERGTLTSGGK